MVIFKYVEEKDVFQKFYSKMLAKRLVQQNSASDDAEASMISKLKVQPLSLSNTPSTYSMQQACGFEYTSKLQKMFQDMSLSKDLNERFRQHVSVDPLDGKWHSYGGNFSVIEKLIIQYYTAIKNHPLLKNH